jgi:hypothetical protein
MRRAFASSLLCFGLLGSALSPQKTLAQESSKARPTQKDTRRRFGQIATRAAANFHAADSIEQRLRAEGASLHPQLISLRLRIQSSLEESRAAMDSGDFDSANEALDRAQGFLDRFARRLGGD